jgi:type II secretory pathway pseudopilin PulG
MKNLGFTLLETIIYCALFSILMTGALVTIYALMSSSENIKEKTNTVAESTFVNQKLAWAIIGAEEIVKVDNETTMIARPDLGVDSPLVINFNNEQLFISRGTSTPQLLVGADFNIQVDAIDISESSVQIVYTINDIPFIFYGSY